MHIETVSSSLAALLILEEGIMTPFEWTYLLLSTIALVIQVIGVRKDKKK
jgi:hypothetical protein